MQPTAEDLEIEIDLRKYLALAWHWAWLIALIAFVSGLAGYIGSSQTTPYYRASTLLLVNEAPATRAADYTALMASKQITSTYSSLITTEPVLSGVLEKLNWDLPVAALREMITIEPVRDTTLIQVAVEATDPRAAAIIANALAEVFSGQIQEMQSARFAQSKAALEAQIAEIEKQIADFTRQMAAETDAADRERSDAKITQYQQIHSSLMQSYEAVRLSEAQTLSTVIQVDPATPPETPVRPKVFQVTLLAALAGLILAAGAVLTREALDDTIKTPEDVTRETGLPVLGAISRHAAKVGAPISAAEPRSSIAEAFRKLRTNVGYASVDQPIHTLLVTSAEPGEGKTTVVSNLAVALAQNEKRVVVIDCDLRHPALHLGFGLQNQEGLSHMFARPREHLNGRCQPTRVERLSAITAGELPPNPAELLGSQRMLGILEELGEKADVILLDTPPILAVTDAAVLAPAVDGVLLVARPGKTRASALRYTVEQLQRAQARLLGVVLNHVDAHNLRYGYPYHHNTAAYQHYYNGHGKPAAAEKVWQRQDQR